MEPDAPNLTLSEGRKTWAIALMVLIGLALYLFSQNALEEILEENKGPVFVISFIPAIGFLAFCLIGPRKLKLNYDHFEIKNIFSVQKINWLDVSEFSLSKVGFLNVEEVVYSYSSDEERNVQMLPSTFGLSPKDLADLMNKYRKQALLRRKK